jgi:hypothetical protein
VLISISIGRPFQASTFGLTSPNAAPRPLLDQLLERE